MMGVSDDEVLDIYLAEFAEEFRIDKNFRNGMRDTLGFSCFKLKFIVDELSKRVKSVFKIKI